MHGRCCVCRTPGYSMHGCCCVGALVVCNLSSLQNDGCFSAHTSTATHLDCRQSALVKVSGDVVRIKHVFLVLALSNIVHVQCSLVFMRCLGSATGLNGNACTMQTLRDRYACYSHTYKRNIYKVQYHCLSVYYCMSSGTA